LAGGHTWHLATRPAISKCWKYTGAGDGIRLMMPVLHDDAQREYAYGPAQGVPDTKVGTFTQRSTNRKKTAGL
jgi:hypothetical protein